MPPRRYTQNPKSSGRPLYEAIGPILDDYEKMLRANPGTAKGGSWISKLLTGGLIHQEPIRNILEKGEDAPVIGPAMGALGRGMDIISRPNYAVANIAQQIQGDEYTGENKSLLDQLGALWQVGASIPAMALPDFLANPLTGGDSGDTSALAKAAWEGLSGKDKVTFAQVLEEQGVANNALKAAGGLGLDIALDPTTYTGIGVVKGPSKGDEILEALSKELTGGTPMAPNRGRWSSMLSDIKPKVPEEPFIGPKLEDVLPTLGPETPPGFVNTNPLADLGDFQPEILGDFNLMGPARTVGDASAYPGPRIFTPNNPLGQKPPVEGVVSAGEKGLSTGDELAQQLSFDDIPGAPKDFNAGKSQQINLFDRRRKGVKQALEGVELNKVIPQEALEHSFQGQLSLQFPDKANEVKWLQLFDPDTPWHVKKSYKPTEGVELLTKTDPWELEAAIDMPARTIGEDWEIAKPLYLPDGPVNIPIRNLASDPVQGLIKAPYEVPGAKTAIDLSKVPPHPGLMTLDEGAELAEPSIIALGEPVKKGRGGKPWNKGPRYNPGKLPPEGAPLGVRGRPVDPLENRGYVSLRFAGNDLAKSYAAYKLGRSVLRPFLYGNGSARHLAKAFTMQAYLPDGMDQMLRQAENTAMADFDKYVRAITSHIGRLSEAERIQITKALDKGENLTDFIPSIGAKEDFANLEHYRALAQGIFDELHIAENKFGVAGTRLDNYVRRIVNSGDDSLAKAKNKDGTFKYSIQELIDKGVDLELDIGEILRNRMEASARTITKADFQFQAVTRFGIPSDKVTPELIKKFDLVPTNVISPELKKYGYVPRHIGEAMNWYSKVFSSDAESVRLMKIVDRAVGEWKYLALLTPGRHTRDVVGDAIMNAQAGVWNPRSYNKARQVLGIHNLGKIDEARNLSMARGIDVVPDLGTISIAGQRIPKEKVWEDLYLGSGSKSGQLSTEVARLANRAKGTGERGRANPLRGYDLFKRGVGRFSDVREDYMRLAHLIDFMDKKAKKPLFNEHGVLTSYGQDLAQEAGRSIRKWNIDYGDLTPFERNTARRIIPFYTFMRHNMPRQMEMLFTKPGFMALYPKGNNAFMNAFGTEEGDDHLLPAWIRESAPFRAQYYKQEQKGAMGWFLKQFGIQPGQQALFDPHSYTTPIGDFSKLDALFHPTDPLQAVGKEIGQMTSPAIKVPWELATGERVFNDQDIKGDYFKYFSEQLPQSRLGYGAITGDAANQNSVMRTLTGVPLRGITESQMGGEQYRRTQEARRLFNEQLEANLPAQYRVLPPEKQREIYRNLIRAQEGS